MGEAGDLIVPVFLNQLECRLRPGLKGLEKQYQSEG
jgi:hypothetical protein